MKKTLAIVLALCIVASLAVIPISAQTYETTPNTKVAGCKEVFNGPLGRKVEVCYETTVNTDYPVNAKPGDRTDWIISMREGTAKVRIYLPLFRMWYERSKSRPIGDKFDLPIQTPIGKFTPKITIGISTRLIISGPGTLSMSGIDWEDEASESFKVDVSPGAAEGENVTVRGNFNYFVKLDMSGPFGFYVEKHIYPETVVLGTMEVSPTPTPTPPTPTPQLCTPYTYRCNGNNLERCNSQGSSWEFQQTCTYGCTGRACNPAPTTPTPIPDSDGDGWDDELERRAGTNPYNVDTDGDGLWDPKDDNPLVAQTPTPTTPIPAFQIIPAIIALVGVAYLLRRRK